MCFEKHNKIKYADEKGKKVKGKENEETCGN